jgi:hypothetical protein
LANVLLSYTHIYGLFVIGSQVLYFLLFRRRYAKARVVFWGAQAITLVGFAPWIFVLITRTFQGAIHGLDWIPEPTLGLVIDAVLLFTGRGLLVLFLTLLFLLLCVAGVSEFRRVQYRHGRNRPPQRTMHMRLGILITEPWTALLLVWFFVPFVLSLILSFSVRPIFWPRYLIGITPALYLLAARGIENIDTFAKTYTVRAKLTWILIVLLALLSVPGLYDLYAFPQREQWREVANLIEQEYNFTTIRATRQSL